VGNFGLIVREESFTYSLFSFHCSAIRSRFPKVNSLDGHELPPPIGFDLPSEESLPSSKAMHCCDNCIKKSFSNIKCFLNVHAKIFIIQWT